MKKVNYWFEFRDSHGNITTDKLKGYDELSGDSPVMTAIRRSMKPEMSKQWVLFIRKDGSKAEVRYKGKEEIY